MELKLSEWLKIEIYEMKTILMLKRKILQTNILTLTKALEY